MKPPGVEILTPSESKTMNQAIDSFKHYSRISIFPEKLFARLVHPYFKNTGITCPAFLVAPCCLFYPRERHSNSPRGHVFLASNSQPNAHSIEMPLSKSLDMLESLFSKHGGKKFSSSSTPLCETPSARWLLSNIFRQLSAAASMQIADLNKAIKPEHMASLLQRIEQFSVPINRIQAKNIFKVLGDNFESISPSLLTKILYHLVKLGFNEEAFLLKIAKRIALSKCQANLSTSDLVYTLFSFSVLDYVDISFMDGSVQLLNSQMDSLSTFQIISSCRALAKFEYVDSKFCGNACVTLIKRLPEILCSKNRVLHLLQALSTMGFAHTLLLTSLAGGLLPLLSKFCPLEVSTILRSFTLLGCYHRDLFLTAFKLPYWQTMIEERRQSFLESSSEAILKNIFLQSKLRFYGELYLRWCIFHIFLLLGEGIYDPNCSSDITLAKLYQSYMGFKIESPDAELFHFSLENSYILKEIFKRNMKFWGYASSALHHEIADILQKDLGIPCETEFATKQGLLLDVAILPKQLHKVNLTAQIDMGRATIVSTRLAQLQKYAIEIDGPFHFLQKSQQHFPPCQNAATKFKQRILTKTGWIVISIPYWKITPWNNRAWKASYLQRVIAEKTLPTK
ncbi:hypothetical protein IE077_002648 [Cardiosporidium cionae]|uniref:RAP domain-containing protein n=1 Tax=Cardiosporidium cionae TaxID=476202 RepID=A0ABQ7JFL0_9APIC|nr:hypothetical protein IE077_002648 [Cardiosporidium cionae]|eukprot:KAF8822778.1 hypothetical protein IE077_002648 [Cardiosporidium cionae]